MSEETKPATSSEALKTQDEPRQVNALIWGVAGGVLILLLFVYFMATRGGVQSGPVDGTHVEQGPAGVIDD